MKFSLPLLCSLALTLSLLGQTYRISASSRPGGRTVSLIPLTETRSRVVASEIGGAFMSGTKCDAEGNLYVRKLATDRPMLGPVVKIDPDGKRVAVFDPTVFSDPKLNRADAFSPASDGGLYQIAGTGGVKAQVYVLRFAADGSPASEFRLAARFEPHSFAAFPGGNLLVSGVQRDALKPSNPGRNFTGVFSDDGRMLAQLAFEQPKAAGKTQTSDSAALTLDLSEAEADSDGNIYAMRRSSPALVYVISPAGKLLHTIKSSSTDNDALPTSFHVSGNRLAISFWNQEKETQELVVADAQTGRLLARYFDPGSLGASFACYAADDGIFTFLHLVENNNLEIIEAGAR